MGDFTQPSIPQGRFSRSLGAAMPCDAESCGGGGADGIGAGDGIECPGQELKTLWMGQRNPKKTNNRMVETLYGCV